MRKLLQSVYSVFKIIKHLNYFSEQQFQLAPSSKILRILGNGKSLNNTLLSKDENVDYLVVNRHVLASNYLDIKPSSYVLADPHFFNHPEGISIIKEINTKTTWPLKLYLPYQRKAKIQINRLITNPLISIIYYNSTSIEGYKKLKYFFFDHQLAMPVVQNVLVASIMIGIQQKYETIELYGVEHTWTKYLFVDENNIVYLDNPHFYDKEKTKVKALKDIQHTDEYPFFLILKNYSRMFESYWEIKEYLKNTKKKVKVLNCTKESFIDAFQKV